MPDTPTPESPEHDAPERYAPYAGVALFPREYTDLTSTAQCPACFHALASVVCGYCGLDLNHPVAAELADVSADVAARLDDRMELIGRIRYDTDRERARQAEQARLARAAEPVVPVPVPVPPVAVAAAPVQFPPPTAAAVPSRVPAAARPTVASDARRRPTVQIALLVVGISLLSIAAVFFLVYAFITYGIVWRSVIIGSITVAAFVAATVLRRRALTGTAEGIGAFAVVLLYLDAFAVRANDLFGAASADGLVYWGVTLVVSAFVLAGWHRLSRLRVGTVAAFAVFAPGVGLLTAGLAEPLHEPARLFASFLAVGLAGLVHPLARDRTTDATPAPTPTAERITALAFAALGLGTAFLTAFAIDFDNEAGISTALGLVAAAALAHVAVVLRSRAGTTMLRAAGAGFAVVGTVAGSLALGILIYRTLVFEAAVPAAATVTVAVALALVYLAHRPLSEPAALVARASAFSATGIAAVALMVPVMVALFTALPVPVVATDGRFWQLEPWDRVVSVDPVAVGAVLGLAVTLALVGGFFAATRLYPRLRPALGWSAAAVLLLAVPLLSLLWAVLAGWFLLAVLAVAAARVPRFARLPFAARLPVSALGAVALLLGFCTGWAGMATWAPALVLTVVLLVAARSTTTPGRVGVRAALLGLAAVVALTGASAAGRQLAVRTGEGGIVQRTAGDGAFDQALLASVVAIAVVALAAVSSARVFSAADRHTLFAIGAPVVLVTLPLTVWSAPIDAAGSVFAVRAVTLVAGLALLAALAAWILPAARRTLQPERGIAVVAVAPALAFTLFAAVAQFALGTEAGQLVLPVSALAVAAGALALVVRRGSAGRRSSDLGVALVAVPGLIGAVLPGLDLAWLVLLLGAVTALLLAIDRDGLVGSASPRKKLGWLSLALATASLWWSLATASVTTVEAYVLPLAGALLLVGLLVWRSAPASRLLPPLVFAALVVALLPVGIAGVVELAAGGPPARAVVAGAVSAALLLGGSLPRSASAVRPYLDAAAAAGFAGLVLVVAGQGIAAAAEQSGAATGVDAWVAAGVVVLVAAGFGQSSTRPGDGAATSVIGRSLVLAGIVLGTVVEVSVLAADDLGLARAVVTVAVLSALYVVCFVVDGSPVDRVNGWIAIAAAAVVAVASLTKHAVDTVEVVSAPIAVALVVVGSLALARDARVRSWAVLGVPLAVVFLPSLLATTVDRPIWRLVAIGVVAVAAIVVGATRRLQAPFVVGIVVALVHGVATFAPQLRSVYQVTEWWVWLGIGGIVVTALSIQYERSLRTAKSVVVGIGNLR